MDLVRLAYYPFLPGVKDAVRELGPDVEALLTSPMYEGVRARAAARVEGAFDRAIPPPDIRSDRDALAELLSIGVARMLCALLADRNLIHRYAAAEGRRTQQVLWDDPSGLLEAAEALDVKVDRQAGWRMHFADYLRVAPQEPDWKLIQHPVSNGYLSLDDRRLAVLLGKAHAARIQAGLDADLEQPVHDSVRTALQPYLDVLAPKLEEARKDWNTGDFGPVQDRLFPPCITTIVDQMVAGEMVSHHARFAVASFLATIGMTAQDILAYFQRIPNFDPDKSRYQITHIAGEQGVERYTPPGCGTMQTNGICPLEKRDNLCFKIKHPLSYYRAQIKFRAEDEKKAAAQIEYERKKKAALAEAQDG